MEAGKALGTIGDSRPLPEIARSHAVEAPERVAFTFLRGDESEGDRVTFGQLHADAQSIAAKLSSADMRGERALLLYPPGIDFVRALLGCFYAGTIAVPAPLPRRSRSLDQRVRGLIDDASARAVLGLADQQDQFREWDSRLTSVSTDDARHTAGADVRGFVDPDGDDVAFLQYTSGSTGRPRGVIVTHSNIVRNLQLMRNAWHYSNETVFVSWLPHFHDMGLVGHILAAIYMGTHCVLMSPATFLQDPARWLRSITRYRGSVSAAPNFAFDLCAGLDEDKKAGLDLTSWEVAVNASEPVRSETIDRFVEAYRAYGLKRHAMRPAYGLAEATLFVSSQGNGTAVTARHFDKELLAQGVAACAARGEGARPLVGCGATWCEPPAIVSPDRRRCAPGVIGEIWVAADGRPNAYWGHAAESDETFAARLADGCGPFLRTGDLGFVLEGELFVTGRLKDLIIVNGINHYPQDLEKTAETAHPGVASQGAAAIGVEVNDKELVVLILEVRRKGSTEIGFEDIAQSVRAAIAVDHELGIEEIVFLKRGGLPRTSSGKLRRSEARRRYLEGEFDFIGRARTPGPPYASAAPPDPSTREVGPHDDIRVSIAQIVAATLGITAVPASIKLNALGLDSLRAAQLAQRVAEQFHTELDLTELFSEASVDWLVSRLTSNGQDHARPPVTVPQISRSERFEPFPLTDMQQAYWLGRAGLYDLGQVALHGYVEIDIPGLDVDRLERAIRILIDRHDMLHAIILPDGRQKVLESVPPYCIQRVDLSNDTSGDELRSLRERMSHEVIPLDVWPPFRVVAAVLADRKARLIASIDATFMDFRSGQVLVRELLLLYSDPVAARGLPLPTFPFRDYVLGQIAQQNEPAYARALAFWLDRIKHFPPPPDLPVNREAATLGSQRIRTLSFRLPAERIDRLRRRLRADGITQAGLMLAAYVEVIGAWSRSPHFTINVPLLGRQALPPGWNYTVGNFSSFVLIEADTSRPADLASRAARLQRDLLTAVKHSAVSGVRVLRELSRRNAQSPGNGTQVVFTHFPSGFDEWDRSLGAMIESQLGKIAYVASQTPQVLLDNLIIEQDDGIQVHWEFVEDVLPDGMIEAMFGSYCDLLGELADDPDALKRVDRQLLPADQRRRRDDANRTAAPIADRTLQSMLREQASARPMAVALVSSGKRLSYAELSARSSAVALCLRKAGLQSGELVAVAMEKGWEQLVAVYGILAAGGVYVPLDICAPDQRLRQIVEASGVRLITTQMHLWKRLNDIFGQMPPIVPIDGDERYADPMTGLPDAVQSPADPAYVLYTSGSTGLPKGVVVSHRAVINMLDYTNRRLGVGPGDAVLSLTALHHDLSVYDIFGLVAAGGTIVLPDPKLLQEPAHWLELLLQERVTIWNSVPASMSMLLTYAEGRSGVRLTSLRQAILGGDWVSLDIFGRLRALSDAQLLSIGGPTETTVWNIWYPVESVDPEWRSIPYGRPIDNTKYFVFDGQLRDRPVWVAGELYCSGACLANGYLHDAEANQTKFLSHPRTGERIYRTGDLGRYLPDGNIEFLGRADFQIKIQGHRIEPGEIEFVLKAHAEVDTAVVVACGAQHQQVLTAYVVPRREVGTNESELKTALRAYLMKRLPVQMVPQRVHLLRELPLSALGKVDRLALGAMREPTAAADESGHRARSRTEQSLSALLAETLELHQPDVERNIFELGANSLHVVQLQSKIQQHFNKAVSVTQIFRHPTVRALAAMLDADNSISNDVVVGRERARRRLVARGATAQGAIAITGIGCRFPGANDARQFWANLAAGVESIERLPLHELLAQGIDPDFAARPDYVRAASALRDVMMFDPEFFAMTSREAALTDPQQRLLLECANDALCDSGHAPQSFDGSIGVFVGCGYGTYLVNNLASEFDLVNFDAARSLPVLIGNDKDYAATRVSYKLDLRGPSVSLGTACSSSLLAVHEACQKLLARECDLALAGGAKVSMPDRVGYLYQEGGVQSSDGHCRPFDASSTGTVFGSGVGIVVLRRLEEALEDNDSIYAVIRGGAVNNDGATKVSYTAPSVQGQVQVIAEAHAVAGISPRTISYVEAHGTGTALGDPIEVASLREAFGPVDGEAHYCGLGSVKSNLGHLDAAAGIAGLIKTALALHHRKIPPTLGFKEPNPQIDFEHGPFYVNTELRDWNVSGAPLRAGVSSFGIGGTNVHLVLEQAPPTETSAAPTSTDRSFHALAISARSEAALQQVASSYAAELETSSAELADFCFTANTGRNHYAYRIAAVADLKAALRERLQSAGRGGSRLVRGVADVPPRIAALYGGQGGQYAGMGRQLFRTQATFREAMERCDALFRMFEGGRSLLDVIFPEDDAKLLDQTRFTQPALFAIQWSMTEVLRSFGIRPDFVLGHSIGEYAAACAAGVFALDDAMKLVAARGRLIDTCCERGAMVAALQPRERIESIVTRFGAELAIAAENGPASTVLAGTPAAIAAASEQLKRSGVRFERLAVSHAFHSPLMEPAIEEFARVASSVSYGKPTCRIVSTAKGAELVDEMADHEYWIDHVRRPVLFGPAVIAAERLGVDTWLEMGVGGSLVALASHCIENKPKNERLIGGLRRGRDEWQELLESLSKLYVIGAPVRWSELDRHQKRRRVRLPGYPYQRIRCSIEPRPVRSATSARVASERLRIAWRGSPHADEAAPNRRRWLIFADSGGFGRELAVALEHTGAACVLVHAGHEFAGSAGDYVVRPDPSEIATVLERECRSATPVDAVLYAWSLGVKPTANGMDGSPDQRALLASQHLLSVVRTVAGFEFKAPPKFVLLTRGAEQVLSDDEIDLGQAPLSAIYKVLAVEHPELEPLQIDIDPKRPPAVGKVLSRLQTMRFGKEQVAERAGASYLARLMPDDIGEKVKPVRLRPDAAYWITGGTGALGLLLARRLAALGARHIVLTSRGRALRRAAEQAIDELRRDGVNVVLRPGDVAAPAEAREILNEMGSSLPALAGVFHAAGVVQDGVLLRQSSASFATVLAPKVAGSWNLHELTRDRALDHFVMFSSSAGLLGSPSQANYAAANAFLDALAHYRRRLNLPAVSIAWGPWADAGMAASSDAQRNAYRRQLLKPLPTGEALDQLEKILGGSGPCTAVLAINRDAARQSIGSLFPSAGPQAAMLGELFRAEPVAEDPGPGPMRSWTKPGSRADGFRAMAARERGPALAAYIRNQLREMLELGIDAPLDAKVPLVDVGLESLAAMSLRNRFSHDLGLKLPVSLLYSHPTVEALSEYFAGQLFPPDQREVEIVPPLPAGDGMKTQFGEMSLDELTGQLEDRISRILGEDSNLVSYSK